MGRNSFEIGYQSLQRWGPPSGIDVMSYIRKRRTQVGYWRRVHYTAANWLFKLGLRRTYYGLDELFSYQLTPKPVQAYPSKLDSKLERIDMRTIRESIHPSQRR
jgi:hypothetical protein